MARLIGMSEMATVEARTVLGNQPFGEQGSYGSKIVGQWQPWNSVWLCR